MRATCMPILLYDYNKIFYKFGGGGTRTLLSSMQKKNPAQLGSYTMGSCKVLVYKPLTLSSNPKQSP